MPHSQYLINRLTNRPSPYIPREKENKLIQYFKQAVTEFHAINTSRINFINYYFVLRKLLKFVKLDDMISEIPQLKNKRRKRDHNIIWYEICQRLDWPFDLI